MGMRCKVCTSDNKLAIEKQIIQGIAHLKISKTFGVPNLSIRNHAMNHLSKKLLKREEAKEFLHSSTLLKEMQELVSKCKVILDRAESNGHSMVSLSAIRELRQIYEFWTKIHLYLKESNDDSELIGERERKQLEILGCLSDEELDTMDALWQKAIDLYDRKMANHTDNRLKQ